MVVTSEPLSPIRELDEETRTLHEEIFGPTDPRTLRMMNSLALDYGLNSDYRRARNLHQEVYLLPPGPWSESYR